MLAVGAAIAVFLGGGLALNSAEPATVVGATAGAIALVIALTFTVGLVSASSGRARYRALRESVGAEAVAIRSTAWIMDGVPVEASDAAEGRKPGRAHQLLMFGADGLELWERPAGGGGTVALPYTAIDHVEVGVASFSDWTDRAVLVSARVRGRRVELGIVPVDEASLLLHPVTDAAYRDLLERIIACAESGRAPGPALEQPAG